MIVQHVFVFFFVVLGADHSEESMLFKTQVEVRGDSLKGFVEKVLTLHLQPLIKLRTTKMLAEFIPCM